MKLRPLNIEKMIKKYDMKEVYNHNIDGLGGLFDPNIFGTGEKKKTQFGYIVLNGHFIDPSTYKVVSKRVFRNLPYIINKEKKFIINSKGVLEQSPEGDTGLDWLYENFNNLKFKDKEDDNINKFTKEDFFISKFPVIPQHYRDINTTENQLKIDELNQLYIDLIRASRFRQKQTSSNSLDTAFIDTKIQGILVSIVDYLANITFFKDGVQREQVMGRSIDNSSRIVISAPEVRMKDTIGKSKVNLDVSCYPLHHILNMYPIHIINKTQEILKYFYDLKLMNLDYEEFEMNFTDDLIHDMIKSYYYSYKDRSSYVVGPNQEKFTFDFEFTDTKGNTSTITRGITWMELFYLAFMEVKDNVRVQFTRYPVTGKGSAVFTKIEPIILNVSHGDLKIHHNNDILYNLEDFCDISSYIEDPPPQIYEETQKISNLFLSSTGGDYDGDKVISRGIYSEEAVKEIDEYINKPIAHLSINGKNTRTVDGECAQAYYDLTLMKPNELVDGNSNINTEINELFKPNTDFLLEDIVNLISKYSIYTKVRFKNNNTTLGRVIFNEVLFNHIENFPFYNETFTNGKLKKLFDDIISEYVITKKIAMEDFKFILNKYEQLGFGICELVATSMTMKTLVKQDDTWDKKDKELRAKYGIDKEDFNDPIAMGEFEKEMIEFAKEYYKDDDMVNMYESGSNLKWNVDFKNIKVALGTTAIPGSTDVDIIKNSLQKGITNREVQASANSGTVAAAARGINTQDTGYEVKRMNAAYQSVFIWEGDCGSTYTHTIVDSNPNNLLGRTIVENGKNIVVTHENVDKYLNKPNAKRTPMRCLSPNGYCSACAGRALLELMNSKKANIGLFVSDIGSELSNKSMKKVHDMTQKLFTIEDMDDWIKG